MSLVFGALAAQLAQELQSVNAGTSTFSFTNTASVNSFITSAKTTLVSEGVLTTAQAENIDVNAGATISAASTSIQAATSTNFVSALAQVTDLASVSYSLAVSTATGQGVTATVDIPVITRSFGGYASETFIISTAIGSYPVGSRGIANTERFGVSSADAAATFADLIDTGTLSVVATGGVGASVTIPVINVQSPTEQAVRVNLPSITTGPINVGAQGAIGADIPVISTAIDCKSQNINIPQIDILPIRYYATSPSGEIISQNLDISFRTEPYVDSSYVAAGYISGAEYITVTPPSISAGTVLDQSTNVAFPTVTVTSIEGKIFANADLPAVGVSVFQTSCINLDIPTVTVDSNSLATSFYNFPTVTVSAPNVGFANADFSAITNQAPVFGVFSLDFPTVSIVPMELETKTLNIPPIAVQAPTPLTFTAPNKITVIAPEVHFIRMSLPAISTAIDTQLANANFPAISLTAPVFGTVLVSLPSVSASAPTVQARVQNNPDPITVLAPQTNAGNIDITSITTTAMEGGSGNIALPGLSITSGTPTAHVSQIDFTPIGTAIGLNEAIVNRNIGIVTVTPLESNTPNIGLPALTIDAPQVFVPRIDFTSITNTFAAHSGAIDIPSIGVNAPQTHLIRIDLPIISNSLAVSCFDLDLPSVTVTAPSLIQARANIPVIGTTAPQTSGYTNITLPTISNSAGGGLGVSNGSARSVVINDLSSISVTIEAQSLDIDLPVITTVIDTNIIGINLPSISNTLAISCINIDLPPITSTIETRSQYIQLPSVAVNVLDIFVSDINFTPITTSVGVPIPYPDLDIPTIGITAPAVSCLSIDIPPVGVTVFGQNTIAHNLALPIISVSAPIFTAGSVDLPSIGISAFGSFTPNTNIPAVTTSVATDTGHVDFPTVSVTNPAVSVLAIQKRQIDIDLTTATISAPQTQMRQVDFTPVTNLAPIPSLIRVALPVITNSFEGGTLLSQDPVVTGATVTVQSIDTAVPDTGFTPITVNIDAQLINIDLPSVGITSINGGVVYSATGFGVLPSITTSIAAVVTGGQSASHAGIFPNVTTGTLEARVPVVDFSTAITTSVDGDSLPGTFPSVTNSVFGHQVSSGSTNSVSPGIIANTIAVSVTGGAQAQVTINDLSAITNAVDGDSVNANIPPVTNSVFGINARQIDIAPVTVAIEGSTTIKNPTVTTVTVDFPTISYTFDASSLNIDLPSISTDIVGFVFDTSLPAIGITTPQASALQIDLPVINLTVPVPYVMDVGLPIINVTHPRVFPYDVMDIDIPLISVTSPDTATREHTTGTITVSAPQVTTAETSISFPLNAITSLDSDTANIDLPTVTVGSLTAHVMQIDFPVVQITSINANSTDCDLPPIGITPLDVYATAKVSFIGQVGLPGIYTATPQVEAVKNIDLPSITASAPAHRIDISTRTFVETGFLFLGDTITYDMVLQNGKYVLNNFIAPELTLSRGSTYVFNYPADYPLRFSLIEDGSHNVGTIYEWDNASNVGNTFSVTPTANDNATVYYFSPFIQGVGGKLNIQDTVVNSVKAVAGEGLVVKTEQKHEIGLPGIYFQIENFAHVGTHHKSDLPVVTPSAVSSFGYKHYISDLPSVSSNAFVFDVARGAQVNIDLTAVAVTSFSPQRSYAHEVKDLTSISITSMDVVVSSGASVFASTGTFPTNSIATGVGIGWKAGDPPAIGTVAGTGLDLDWDYHKVVTPPLSIKAFAPRIFNNTISVTSTTTQIVHGTNAITGNANSTVWSSDVTNFPTRFNQSLTSKPVTGFRYSFIQGDNDDDIYIIMVYADAENSNFISSYLSNYSDIPGYQYQLNNLYSGGIYNSYYETYNNSSDGSHSSPASPSTDPNIIIQNPSGTNLYYRRNWTGIHFPLYKLTVVRDPSTNNVVSVTAPTTPTYGQYHAGKFANNRFAVDVDYIKWPGEQVLGRDGNLRTLPNNEFVIYSWYNAYVYRVDFTSNTIAEYKYNGTHFDLWHESAQYTSHGYNSYPELSSGSTPAGSLSTLTTSPFNYVVKGPGTPKVNMTFSGGYILDRTITHPGFVFYPDIITPQRPIGHGDANVTASLPTITNQVATSAVVSGGAHISDLSAISTSFNAVPKINTPINDLPTISTSIVGKGQEDKRQEHNFPNIAVTSLEVSAVTSYQQIGLPSVSITAMTPLLTGTKIIDDLPAVNASIGNAKRSIVARVSDLGTISNSWTTVDNRPNPFPYGVSVANGWSLTAPDPSAITVTAGVPVAKVTIRVNDLPSVSNTAGLGITASAKTNALSASAVTSTVTPVLTVKAGATLSPSDPSTVSITPMGVSIAIGAMALPFANPTTDIEVGLGTKVFVDLTEATVFNGWSSTEFARAYVLPEPDPDRMISIANETRIAIVEPDEDGVGVGGTIVVKREDRIAEVF